MFRIKHLADLFAWALVHSYDDEYAIVANELLFQVKTPQDYARKMAIRKTIGAYQQWMSVQPIADRRDVSFSAYYNQQKHGIISIRSPMGLFAVDNMPMKLLFMCLTHGEYLKHGEQMKTMISSPRITDSQQSLIVLYQLIEQLHPRLARLIDGAHYSHTWIRRPAFILEISRGVPLSTKRTVYLVRNRSVLPDSNIKSFLPCKSEFAYVQAAPNEEIPPGFSGLDPRFARSFADILFYYVRYLHPSVDLWEGENVENAPNVFGNEDTYPLVYIGYFRPMKLERILEENVCIGVPKNTHDHTAGHVQARNQVTLRDTMDRFYNESGTELYEFQKSCRDVLTLMQHSRELYQSLQHTTIFTKLNLVYGMLHRELQEFTNLLHYYPNASSYTFFQPIPHPETLQLVHKDNCEMTIFDLATKNGAAKIRALDEQIVHRFGNRYKFLEYERLLYILKAFKTLHHVAIQHEKADQDYKRVRATIAKDTNDLNRTPSAKQIESYFSFR